MSNCYIRPMGANNHPTTDVDEPCDETSGQRETADFSDAAIDTGVRFIEGMDAGVLADRGRDDEWAVEMVRHSNGSRFEIPGFVTAPTEAQAHEKATEMVNRVLDGASASYKRGNGYYVEVSKVIA